MTKSAKAKKKAARQSSERPVVQFRIHEDLYTELKEAAESHKKTLSEEVVRCIGLALDMDRQKLTQDKILRLGAEEFLIHSGYTKVREADGTELWAKGAAAVAKWTALGPEVEAIIERVVSVTLQKVKPQ